ncbi:MmcQ/YjbR family DNA-binding protein [Saccharomonospora cyanea]|uniref:YjbR protein n=1 Tax=Saccharomonospora cyanea NA-134 TaxID=882082 RepID=H5XQE3_9PSEU|nr:MmcQ/YjbR family DNA-binding protein [Saccharomonospora cyanea]EHR63876.1 hypothetical protein SaccyDRAFT_5082 [Saccharomonospora cyanea NA-134]
MPNWDDVVELATRLPGVEISTSYRTPAAKVRGKTFLRLRTEAEGWLMLMCELEEKEAMLASGSPAFHTTAHYDGYGAILVDLAEIDEAELGELVEQAWRLKAPARLRKEIDG